MPSENFSVEVPMASPMVANVYAGSAETYTGSLGGHLFLWITLTMIWVVIILAIMALIKYITHETPKRKK